jgi:hypothetical protein
MWFDIVKLDLSQVSSQIQGDTEGKNINIEESDKCKEKIRRFERNLYDEFISDIWANPQGMLPDKVPEKVYCWMVEQLDKFFNSDFQEKWQNEMKYLEEDFHEIDKYTIELFSSLRLKTVSPQTPFSFKLFRYNVSYKPLIDCRFDPILGLELLEQRYKKIKSCWRRA